MNELIEVSAYEYEGTVLVELTGRDTAGEIVVRSYEFDAGPDGTARPRESIESADEAAVREALTDTGYTLPE